jgi:hypothetical protein
LVTLYQSSLKVKYTDTAAMLANYANIGRKNIFSVKQTFNDTLVAASKINFSGIAYAASNTGKVSVLTQDTTTGYITRTSAQFIDTTGKADGSVATWSSTANNFILSALLKYKHTIFTPTTGGTITLINNQYNIVNPSGTLSTLTVTLPSSPANNDVVIIKYTKAITTVTYSGGTVSDGITSPTAGGEMILTYDSGTSTWY